MAVLHKKALALAALIALAQPVAAQTESSETSLSAVIRLTSS